MPQDENLAATLLPAEKHLGRLGCGSKSAGQPAFAGVREGVFEGPA